MACKMDKKEETCCEENIIRPPSLDYTPDPRGIGYELFNALITNKSSIAQIDGITGNEETHESLLMRSIRTAIEMRNRGITSGDIITLCTFNCMDTCVPILASMFLGVKFASLDPTLSLSDTVYLLTQVKPKMIFVGSEAEQLIEQALKEAEIQADIVMFGGTTKYSSFGEFLGPNPSEDSFQPKNCNSLYDTAVIFFSSGTSGFPKGICINHFGFLHQVHNLCMLTRATGRHMLFSSAYWISSVFYLIICIKSNTARIIFPKFCARESWNLVQKYKPTSMFLAPNQINDMIDARPTHDVDTSSLRYLQVGGAKMSTQQMENTQKHFPTTCVIQYYGLTESSGAVLCFNYGDENDMKLHAKYLESVGRPVPGIEYKIVDAETDTLLGPNETGELRLKSKYFMNGYYNMESSSAWDENGWLKTGDLVYYNEDKCFFIEGRVKEMLKFQSWHVPPAVVESVLAKHPDVLKSIVIGIPHERDGDHPMGIIVLKKTASNVNVKEIEKFVEERVHDRQRLRAGVRIVDEFPVTPSGKIKRREIIDMVLSGKIV